MKANNGTKFLILMSFHLLWGGVLWFSISKLGLWISTDSVHLLFGGLNLAETGRLVSFDLSPLLQWPPLYSTLLAAGHLISGRSPFAAAHLLQAVSFTGISACTSLLLLRMFPENFLLAVAGNVLADIGVVVVSAFDLLGSDYLHLFFVVLCLLLSGLYIAKPSGRTFAALAIAGMLAMLERYIGLAAIITGIVSVSWLAKGSTWQRIVRGFVLATTALPTLIWQALTVPLLEQRGPLTFSENFLWFSESILEWFLPTALIEEHPAVFITLLWLLVAASAALILLSARGSNASPFAKPVLLYGVLYILALFGAASLTDFNKLGGRFLLPLYLPFITMLLICAQLSIEFAHRQTAMLRPWIVAGVAFLLAVSASLALRTSIPVILDSHAGVSGLSDNAYNTMAWRDNAAIQYWQKHAPPGRYLLFSNYPDPVAFYAEHSSMAAPKQYAGPYSTDEIPLEGYAAGLFAKRNETYLIWIEPNYHEYYYSPDDLTFIADVTRLFNSKDGAVYLLSPKEGD